MIEDTPITEAESLVDERASDADTPDTTDTGALGGTEAASNPNAEAAKYRVRARSAEAALATAQARVELLQSRELERIASKQLANPADLLTLGGVALADLLDDNGEVDPEKVNAVATEVLGSRPGLRPNQPAYDRTQGLWSEPAKPVPSWSALLSD